MATNFLWYSGTSSFNGLLASAITLLASETSQLASSGTAVSIQNGASSGIFTSSQTGQAILGYAYLTIGTSLTAATAGSNIAGWFLTSLDGGTTFETQASSVAPQPRSPDFTIPMSSAAADAGAGAVLQSQGGPFIIPPLKYRAYIQNNLGQTISSGTTISLAPVAWQY